MSAPSLTNALNFFGRIFDHGRDALSGQASSLFQTFVMFEVVFAGLYLAFGSGADFKGIARKLLTIGLFSWIIQNYAWLLKEVIDGFLLVGQQAGSTSGVTFASLQDPDSVFIKGMQICKPLMDKLYQDWNASSFIPSIDTIFLFMCMCIAVFSFGIMAIQVFITYLEFLLVSTAGFIFIPFGIFKPTAFLAERMFGAIIGFGIKLMILALIIAVSDQFLTTLTLSTSVSWQQGFEFVIVALALCFLTLHAPSVALSLLSGSPHLSFGSVAGTGAATALAASKSAGGVGTGVGALGSAVKSVGGAGIAGAGSMYGGAISDLSKSKENGKSLGGSMVSAAAAGVAAPIKALASNTVDKVMWGQDGGANGQARYRASIGDESLRRNGGEGIVGKFNSGMYSVPEYRKHDAKKRAEDKNPTKTDPNKKSDKKDQDNKENQL